MSRTLRIGTRASALALWQANWVKQELEKKYPDLTVTLTKIKTQGDKILDVPLAMVGGKGLFVKEIQEAMLRFRSCLVQTRADGNWFAARGNFIFPRPRRTSRLQQSCCGSAPAEHALRQKRFPPPATHPGHSE